jgi:malonyl-CoA O-methyltransferase
MIEQNNNAFFLARTVAENMLANLEWMTLQPEQMVVLGGEVDYSAELLKKRYPQAKMATEIINLPDHSVDLIFANLVLPWCQELKKILHDWRRIIRPEGLLMFSSLGPDTLKELKTSLLPALIDMHDIGDELVHARFADPVMEMDQVTVSYSELQKLTHELQLSNMIGKEAHINMNPNADNIFSLTYEVIYGHAWGPSLDVDHVADESGVVKIPLAHLRRKT